MCWLLLESCGQIAGSGDEQSVIINLPHIANGSSRSISGDDISRLREDTRKYRVIFQTSNGSVVREGTGGAFSASFAVATEISVTVECLNGSDEVIVRTVAKTLTVGAGDNSLSFNLSQDGTEVIPQNKTVTLYVSATGDDSNSGTSASDAFAQLKKACDVINDGSDTSYTIIVSGTITEREACILNTNKTVTIKTGAQPATILRGSGETNSDGSGPDFKIEITNGTVNFEGTAAAPLTIDGNKNQFSGHQYLLLHITSDSNNVNVFIGSNVNFQNNSMTKAWAMGSAVRINGAGVTLTLDGGTIKDNVSWRLAAGVEIRDGATFIMNSGTISGNTVTTPGSDGDGSGGGVYVGGPSASKFTMNGGTITRNSAQGRGGGIFVEADGICTVSPSASVIGNTATGDGAGSSGNQIYAQKNATYNGTKLTSITKVE